MKFLICGLGSIGQRHYKNLKKLGFNDILVYRTKKGSNQNFINNFEKKFKPQVFYNLNEALAKKPKAVLITNPTSLHVPLAIKAAKAGIHVFTEKPLSCNIKGVEKLISEIKKHKLVGYVGYNFRFHPLLKQMKKWVEAGKIGKVLSAQAEIGEYLPDWHPWENYQKTYAARKDLDGGVVLTQSHDLDYLYWFFGKAKYIASVGGKKSDLKINVDDLVKIIIEFKSGIITAVHMDYLKRPPKRQFEILGTKGRIIWNYEEKKLTFISLQKGVKPLIIKEPLNFERNSMFIKELKHFIKCLRGKEKPLVDLSQGKEVLKIILAIKKSLKDKKIIKL
ncbi:Gfo/Idh/MocA family oxidoreductase [Patescibacteria group bacterium]|nr:Gfo/Idh/MocA family oxidoreductase [Patescibacteria group bacterium]